MEKGDKVVIKPHHDVYIVEKVDEGFIWVNGRPYMRGQLDYAEEQYKPVYHIGSLKGI